MQTMTPVSEIIANAKSSTERYAAQLLHTFSFVPDDKLNFKPSETSKSALQLVAHIAVSNYGISGPIRRQDPGDMTFEQLFAYMAAEEAKITTREQAIAAVNASVQEVLSALDTVTDEAISGTANSPFGEMPMMFWVFLPGNHMLGHSYQIDYLQTIWGDLDFHFAQD